MLINKIVRGINIVPGFGFYQGYFLRPYRKWGIAVAKHIAAMITGSASMLAEAVHSTADCGNQLLLLLGMNRAKKPPSDDYPLGYGKETYF